jgi:DNA-binding NarL/FixJ family response regulator
MAREPIRVVLADNQLRGQAGMHILAMAQQLLADFGADTDLLEMAFPTTFAPLPGSPPASSRVFVLCDDQTQAYIFGVLPGGGAGPFTTDEALDTIADTLRSVQRGTRHRRAYQVIPLRFRQRGSTAEIGQSLTERETDVLWQLATGKSDRAIAAHLGIAHRTVRYHLKRIYAKLGVEQRHEALVWAVRAGWGI